MALLLAWVRHDVRSRRRSLLVLALLIAVASGTVMTAVVGAKRGASAVDRLQAETLPATVLVAPYRPDFDWGVVRSLPQVEALGELAMSGFEIDGEPAGASLMLPPVDTEVLRTIENPVVLEGRLANPKRSDEVVVTRAFVDSHAKGVGDQIALGLYAPDQVDIVEGPDTMLPNNDPYRLGLYTNEQIAAALDAGWNINETEPARGPVVEATIVGIIRSLWFGDQRGSPGFVVPSAGLFAEHTPHLLGEQGLAATAALVRLEGGAAAIPVFRQDLAAATGRADIDVSDRAAVARAVREASRFEANVLYVFAAVSGIASVALIGVAVARCVVPGIADLRVLRTLGMTRGQLLCAAVAGPAGAAWVGAMLGSVAAVATSSWFPIGSAAGVEPAPGLHADAAVLLAGLVGVPALVAAVAAVRALRSADAIRSSRTSAAATTASRLGLPVPIVAGVRFALEPGQGRYAVPVRPALVGAMVGVTGLLAALTFGSGLDDAASNPARHGIVHQVEAYVGYDSFTFAGAPAEDVFPAMAAVPGVMGINDTRGQWAEIDGERVMVHSFSPVGAPLDYVVTAGRLPVEDTELMLDGRIARSQGAAIGDKVRLTAKSRQLEMVVAGVGINEPGFPIVRLSPVAYELLFGEAFHHHYGEVGIEPGVDPAGIVPLLHEAVDAVPGAGPESVAIFPTDFESPAVFRYMLPLPLVLAGFLVVLGLGAVGHGLAAAVRLRSHDLAILKALGMTPRQARGVVATHATVVALAAIAVGIPLGVALGRSVWRYVSDVTDVQYAAPTATLGLALVVPIVLITAGLLATWPATRASSLRVADALRAE